MRLWLSSRRWRLWHADRRLRIAGYWWACGDLIAAARHAGYAWRLVRRDPAPPVGLAVRVSALVASVEGDLGHPDESRAALEWALRRLDGEPRGADLATLLAAALTGLGDCHRRAGRYR